MRVGVSSLLLVLSTCNQVPVARQPPPGPAPAPPPASCVSFSGLWQKEDGFRVRIDQHGCAFRGDHVNPASGWAHTLRGTVSGNVAQVTVRRQDDHGCINMMTLRLVMQPDGQTYIQDTLGTNGRCNLSANFTEHFVYRRIQ